MVAGILFALLLQHALGLRVSRMDSRMALSSARDSYYFGARSKAASAHQPLYVAASTIDIETARTPRVTRTGPSTKTAVPEKPESPPPTNVVPDQRVARRDSSSSEAPSKMNYSFGARLPRSGETYSQPRTDFQSRAEVQSRVDVQPAVTASSRSSSEAPSKMNYSFGARLPRSGTNCSHVGVASGGKLSTDEHHDAITPSRAATVSALNKKDPPSRLASTLNRLRSVHA